MIRRIQRPTLLATVTTYLLLRTSLLCAAPVLFASAEGINAQSGGLSLSDNAWPMHRVELTRITQVETIGGFFGNDHLTESQTIFGAIIALTGPNDTPDSLDLSTPDLITTTLIDLSPGEMDGVGQLDIVLLPGWYAIAFGTGRLGAPPEATLNPSMPALTIDLDPAGYSFTAIQSFNGGTGFFQNQSSTSRFFLTGEPIPEPTTYALALTTSLCFVVKRWP